MQKKSVFDFDANLKNEAREGKALQWLAVTGGTSGLLGP